MQRIAIGIYGSGGFAREVLPIARETVARNYRSEEVALYFVETSPVDSTVNGCPVLSEKDFLSLEADAHYFNVAIGNSRTREAIAARMLEKGARALAFSANNVAAYDACELGEGAILCANGILTSNVRIGRFFHLNLGSYVAHDCVIGHYVTFAPNVACNGNVHIGDHAYVGTGAIIKQGTPQKPLVIGEGATVGMGAVVTKDVPPGVTVIGSPARPLAKD